MRSKRIVGALTALILAVQLAALAEPSSATQACSAGGNPAPWAAEYEDEVEHLGGIELCEFADGRATVTNSTDQVWYFAGPGDVEMWTGLDRIGAMHRLSEAQEPGARYMLPGERVVLTRWQEMHWYLDRPRTTRWMMLNQIFDAAEAKSVAAGGQLIGLKSKSGAALWSCTAGAYKFGKTLNESNATGQGLIESSLVVGTSAESCRKSWNALAKRMKVSQQLPSLSAVTKVAKQASQVNGWTKLLRALAQMR